jgi:transcriptional regulator with XRE-family HTH domain
VEQQHPVVDHRRFGTYLRRIREERRLSLDAVEELSAGLPERLTKSHLSRMENGQAVPTFPRMFALSRIYGVPVSFLAERFELSLKQSLSSADLEARPSAEVAEEAKKLRLAGRHDEALWRYEVLLDREALAQAPNASAVIDLRLECINCLIKLAREASAKEECEKLLGDPGLGPTQRFVTLQYLASCCYHMGKFTVALMAIENAERELARVEAPGDLPAHLANLKGNVAFVERRYADAAEAYRQSLVLFEAAGNAFEACRVRLNLAAAMIDLGAHAPARAHLKEALHQAEGAGYERQQAFALSHLGLLAFREGDLDATEAQCIRSNRIARPREYLSLLFRNCYYLWEVARARKDEASVRANERALRAYLSRVDEHIPEAEKFRAHLGGGKSDV